MSFKLLLNTFLFFYLSENEKGGAEADSRISVEVSSIKKFPEMHRYVVRTNCFGSVQHTLS